MVSAAGETQIVTVTGISGYIGSQVGLAFLNDGGFVVRGTVRDPKNEKKVEPLKKAFGDKFESLTLVAADLLDEDSLDKAIEGSTHVAHVASPFIIGEPKDEKELINPAVNGTLAVLKACRKHKVKRVVVTSSVASVCDTHPDDEPDDDIYNESHWSDPDRPDGMSAYAKSKVMAERAAWEYLEGLPEDEKFEMTVINPCFVVGPTMIGGDFSSGKVVRMLMMSEFPAIPKISFGTVDVREVAQAHVNALKIDEAQGKRFILSNECLWFTEIAEILNKEFGDKGYSVNTSEAKYCLMKFAAIFSTEASASLKYWGVKKLLDSTRSKEILKINYRPAEESFREMGYSLVKMGIVPNKGDFKFDE